MKFTSTPPTEPGFYAWKIHLESRAIFNCFNVLQDEEGELYCDNGSDTDPLPLNGFWCRLYPSDELVPVRQCEVEKLKDDLSTEMSIVKTLKEQLSTSQQQVEVLREALQPFGSGIDIIQWGMIKASIPEAAARKLTRYNCVADNALALTNPAVEP